MIKPRQCQANRLAANSNMPHFHAAAALLVTRSMLRWTNIVGALLLVLMIWTGASAHAAERFDCVPVTEQAAGHFEGDRDEVPSDPDRGVAHHHSGCGGHHVAGPGQYPAFSLNQRSTNAVVPRQDADHPGREPDGQLRPPIA